MSNAKGYIPFQQDPLHLKSADYHLLYEEYILIELNKCIINNFPQLEQNYLLNFPCVYLNEG